MNLKNFKGGIPGVFSMANSLREAQKTTKIFPFGVTSNLAERGTDCSCHICLFVVSVHSLIWL